MFFKETERLCIMKKKNRFNGFIASALSLALLGNTAMCGFTAFADAGENN